MRTEPHLRVLTLDLVSIAKETIRSRFGEMVLQKYEPYVLETNPRGPGYVVLGGDRSYTTGDGVFVSMRGGCLCVGFSEDGLITDCSITR